MENNISAVNTHCNHLPEKEDGSLTTVQQGPQPGYGNNEHLTVESHRYIGTPDPDINI